MPKILLVEDNEQNRDLLSRLLQQRGYTVVTAVDGKEGIATAQAALPDVILMDLHLPDVDGWEATRGLKAEPETRAIPVIALTAYAATGDRERALEAGCEDYHEKPVEFSRLLMQIEALLKSAPSRGLEN
jgi:CheY-like chemotaxis protein